MLAADAHFALGSVLVVAATLRRALAPIEAFARRLAEVQRQDQSLAISELTAPVELRPIAESVMGMLDRLGAAHDAREIEIELERTISTLLRLWRDERARDQALGTAELGALLQEAMRGEANAYRLRHPPDAVFVRLRDGRGPEFFGHPRASRARRTPARYALAELGEGGRAGRVGQG